MPFTALDTRNKQQICTADLCSKVRLHETLVIVLYEKVFSYQAILGAIISHNYLLNLNCVGNHMVRLHKGKVAKGLLRSSLALRREGRTP